MELEMAKVLILTAIESGSSLQAALPQRGLQPDQLAAVEFRLDLQC